MSAHHGTSGKRGSGSPYESDAEPRYDVQTWRKIAYYAGAALTLLVFSFFDGLSSGSGGSGPGSFVAFRDFPLAFVGFFLILAGQGLRAVGRRGLAGSGVVLSPEGEARDAEPWRRSRGAQMQDALEEMPMVRDAVAQGAAGQPQIRVRCTACGYLETEDARFCSGCGASMFPS